MRRRACMPLAAGFAGAVSLGKVVPLERPLLDGGRGTPPAVQRRRLLGRGERMAVLWRNPGCFGGSSSRGPRPAAAALWAAVAAVGPAVNSDHALRRCWCLRTGARPLPRLRAAVAPPSSATGVLQLSSGGNAHRRCGACAAGLLAPAEGGLWVLRTYIRPLRCPGAVACLTPQRVVAAKRGGPHIIAFGIVRSRRL